MKGSTGGVLKVLGVFGLGLCFVLTASVVDPGLIKASDQVDNPRSDRSQPSAPKSSKAILGELVGGSYRVRIHAGSPDPRYSVFDQNGRMVADELTRAELALRFPGVPLADLDDAPALSDVPVDGTIDGP